MRGESREAGGGGQKAANLVNPSTCALVDAGSKRATDGRTDAFGYLQKKKKKEKKGEETDTKTKKTADQTLVCVLCRYTQKWIGSHNGTNPEKGVERKNTIPFVDVTRNAIVNRHLFLRYPVFRCIHIRTPARSSHQQQM